MLPLLAWLVMWGLLPSPLVLMLLRYVAVCSGVVSCCNVLIPASMLSRYGHSAASVLPAIKHYRCCTTCGIQCCLTTASMLSQYFSNAVAKLAPWLRAWWHAPAGRHLIATRAGKAAWMVPLPIVLATLACHTDDNARTAGIIPATTLPETCPCRLQQCLNTAPLRY